MGQTTTTTLKTDVLGRVKIGKEQREAVLDAFEQSGMSGVAFAKHHGVNYQTFASWIQKRRRERGQYHREANTDNKESAKFTMVEVEVPEVEPPSIDPVPASGIEIVLGGDLMIRVEPGASVPLVVELIKALKSC